MTEQQPVPFEQKGIIPLNREELSQAIVTNDVALSFVLQDAIRATQTPEQEVAIYQEGLKAIYQHMKAGEITPFQFHQRVQTVVLLDVTQVDEDGEISINKPRIKTRKVEPEIIAYHARIIQAIRSGLRNEPAIWKRIVSTISTNQLELLGKPDLFFCGPARMSQYLANAIHHNHHDMQLIVQVILEREDEDYLLQVREELVANQPAAYKTFKRFCKEKQRDWAVEFITYGIIDDEEYE